MISTLEALFPDDAETYEALETTTVAAEDIPVFVETFLSEWAYWEMAPTFEAKFALLANPAEYEHREQELRGLLNDLVALKLNDRDPRDIEWASEDGRGIVEAAIETAYAIVEEDFEP